MRVLCGNVIYEVKKAWVEECELIALTIDDKVIIADCESLEVAESALKNLFCNGYMNFNVDVIIKNWKEYQLWKNC